MSTFLVLVVSFIITLLEARPCDLTNPCEAHICQDVRWSCGIRFDCGCTMEMFDECEGWLAQHLPATFPAGCGFGGPPIGVAPAPPSPATGGGGVSPAPPAGNPGSLVIVCHIHIIINYYTLHLQTKMYIFSWWRSITITTIKRSRRCTTI